MSPVDGPVIDRVVIPAAFGIRPIDDYTGDVATAAPPMSIWAHDDDPPDPDPAEDEKRYRLLEDLRTVVTPQHIVTFPGVGFRPIAQALEVRIEATPQLRPLMSTITVPLPPYPDPAANPPDRFPAPRLIPAVLLPGPNYPYLIQTRVIRGELTGADGHGVADVEISVPDQDAPQPQRAMTDGAGTFAVGLRWFDPAAPIALVASTHGNELGRMSLNADKAFDHNIAFTLA